MKKMIYADAKKLVDTICSAARAGEYETRTSFFEMVAGNPDLAVQGYNAFGKIFYWNTPSAHLYGYSESAAVNKDLFDLLLPQELRGFARDLISTAYKTGRTPDASACDLIQRNGEYITVFSGHLMFQWDHATTPEFYCIDIGIEPQPA